MKMENIHKRKEDIQHLKEMRRLAFKRQLVQIQKAHWPDWKKYKISKQRKDSK